MSGSFLSLLEQRTAVSRHDRLNTRYVVMREHIITPRGLIDGEEEDSKREREKERKRETERKREREEEKKRKREKEKKRKRKSRASKKLESVPAKNECSTRFVAMGVFFVKMWSKLLP